MKFLLIDTTADKTIIGTYVDGNVDFLAGSGDKGKTSSSIIPNVQTLLSKVNLDVVQLDCVFAVVGPGSFTGIRIGVSTATAIAFAVGAKKGGLTVFDGFASDDLCVIPSRRGFYYYQKGEELGELREEDLLNADFCYRQTRLENGKYIDDFTYVTNLFEVGKHQFEQDNLQTLEPMYLKKSQAERQKFGD